MEINTPPYVDKFFKSLEKPTQSKLVRTLELLQQFGSALGPPHTKKISPGLCELRIRGQQEIRIFYLFKNNQVYLLHGFVKKSQKTPSQELAKAQKNQAALDI